MDKEFLSDCLAKGMSLPQIGRLTDRPPGTVGYWVAKHGLVANGKEKFSPGAGSVVTQAALEPLVMEGRTIKQIAEELGVGPNCIRYRIEKYGLPQPREVRRTMAAHALGTGARRSRRECRRHGETEFVLELSGTWRCCLCRQQRISDRRRKVKRILIAEAGGSCRICGYDRSVAALHFHHLDPARKRFTVSRSGYTRGIDQARVEAAKCVLLCANCHAEVESGVTPLPADVLQQL